MVPRDGHPALLAPVAEQMNSVDARSVDEDQRYPVGRFRYEGFDERRQEQWIEEIAATPAHLRAAVNGLSAAQLDTPYRTGGWTVRQVVHHVPDSHLNAYLRMKLALTEDEPTIKPYDEAVWAELSDSRAGPIGVSLAFLEGLHQRWVLLLRTLRSADFERRFIHPEHGRAIGLGEQLGTYAWHGRHHVAHITSLRARKGWD
jgi:DinB superfamily